MKTRTLILASLLVALAGIAFVVPAISSASFDAVACPGPVCVTKNNVEDYKGGGMPAWGAPDDCAVKTWNCLGTTGCCQKCLNMNYEIDHVVGYCYRYREEGECCGMQNEKWDETCPM